MEGQPCAEPVVQTFLPGPNRCDEGSLIGRDCHNLCFLKMSLIFFKALKYEYMSILSA